MLTDIAIKEKTSGFMHYSLLFLALLFFLIFGSQAQAAEIKLENSADLNSSAKRCCCDNNSDPGNFTRSKAKHDGSGSSCKPICCPGPKGPRGPRGPQGAPACPGALTDFASYQLIFLPGQMGMTIGGGTAIPFQRQVLIFGSSITAFAPFSSFLLKPGTYEISIGVSNDTVEGIGPANQIELVVSPPNGTSTTYTFPANGFPVDFLTFRKIVEIYNPNTAVSVTTVNSVTLTPPTLSTTSGVGAYINIVRIQ
jgi:hypothetical protein